MFEVCAGGDTASLPSWTLQFSEGRRPGNSQLPIGMNSCRTQEAGGGGGLGEAAMLESVLIIGKSCLSG